MKIDLKKAHSLTPKEFNKLPLKERRLLIAKDVQFQLENNLVKATHRYVGLSYDNSISDESFKKIKDTNPYQIKCTGCVRASMFLSLIGFVNKLTVYETEYSYFYYSDPEAVGTVTLSKLFGVRTQALIESAYEVGEFGGGRYQNEVEAAIRYGHFIRQGFVKKLNKGWTRDSYVMWWLMENIIKNKGEFIIPKQFFKK